MIIVFVICKEDGALDPDSLLGHLVISDGVGAIKARSTYIDAWLDALICGLRSAQEKRSCEVDLVDEPDPLIFDVLDDELYIHYRDMTVNAGKPENFADTLRATASVFLDAIHEEVGGLSNEMLMGVQRFISQK